MTIIEWLIGQIRKKAHEARTADEFVDWFVPEYILKPCPADSQCIIDSLKEHGYSTDMVKMWQKMKKEPIESED